MQYDLNTEPGELQCRFTTRQPAADHVDGRSVGHVSPWP